MESPLIYLENVEMTYKSGRGAVQALAGINMAVKEGTFVSIIGPSGCGKSTLLKIIGGLLAPSAGKVIVRGEPVEAARQKKLFGFVFQDAALPPWRNVLDNTTLLLEIIGTQGPKAMRERARQLLTMVA